MPKPLLSKLIAQAAVGFFFAIRHVWNTIYIIKEKIGHIIY